MAGGLEHTAMHRTSPPLVLHVIHHLRMGGLENGLVNLVNHMPVGAYRHAVACIEDYSDFRDRIDRPGVEVLALHRSKVGVWKLRGELFELCRRLRPAIVHTRNMSGLDALLPARLAGVPHRVHGEHGWDVDNLDGRQWKPALLRKAHAPLVDRYITVSRDLRRFLVDRIGVDGRRVTQIYNGVDTERFRPATRRPLELLPESLRSPARLRIGTVGRAQAVKDQATLLQAVAGVVERHPDLRARLMVAVVGDGPLLPELRALTVALGIDDIAWLPGAMANVPEVLQLLDVFVLPSLNEGISNTILEALATGLPVLATAAGGNPELVDVDVTGALFRPRDVQALCDALEHYVHDEALRWRQGMAARQVALERFSLASMVEQYQSVYDGVLGRAGAPATSALAR